MTTHLLGSASQMTVAIERKVDLLSKEAISKVLAAEAEASAIRERAEADARGMVEACEKTCAEEQTAALTAAADEKRFCKDCVHFMPHPFVDRCDLDNHPVDPMDDCSEFALRK